MSNGLDHSLHSDNDSLVLWCLCDHYNPSHQIKQITASECPSDILKHYLISLGNWNDMELGTSWRITNGSHIMYKAGEYRLSILMFFIWHVLYSGWYMHKWQLFAGFWESQEILMLQNQNIIYGIMSCSKYMLQETIFQAVCTAHLLGYSNVQSTFTWVQNMQSTSTWIQECADHLYLVTLCAEHFYLCTVMCRALLPGYRNVQCTGMCRGGGGDILVTEVMGGFYT
jgi:hypothetical protein